MTYKPNNSGPNSGPNPGPSGSSTTTTPTPYKPGSPATPGTRTPFTARPRPFPTRDRNFRPEDKDDVRVNERIRVPQVRLIGHEGEQIGIVPTQDALRRARDLGLDLIEVAPTAQPPVCKILDYGKFKYEKKKKEHQAKKNQVVVKVKEIQLRPATDEHDLDYKIRNARSFLEEGDKAKIIVMFRGREITHTEPGFALVNKIIDQLKDIAIIESPPKLEGKKLMTVLALNPAVKKTLAKKAQQQKPAGSSSEKSSDQAQDESENSDHE